MNFLSPWFLFGAAAVAGPILFHLIRRSARQRTSFSSIMFLRPTPPRAVRRSKLEHILLLLLRCLCLLLLAFGFARPFFARDILPPPASKQERRIVLLVDTSASMRRPGLWEKARTAVDEYLDRASPSDQIALVTFDTQTRNLVTFADWSSWPEGQRASMARQRLAAISPGWMGTHLGLALTGAAEQFHENSAGLREIVLVTDLQEGAKLDGLQGYQWPTGTRVFVRAVTSKKQSNAGLEILEQPTGVAGVDNDIHVRVSNSSDSQKEKFRLGWSGSNERMEIYVTPGQTRTFTAPKLPASMISNAPPAKIAGFALELSGDDLDYDNVSYYVVPEIQHVSIFCAGLGSADDSSQMFYYLQRAFPSTPRWQVQFSPELTEQTSFAIVATNLDPQQLSALRHLMESGKSALLVLDNSYAAATLVNLLGLSDARLTESDGEFALLGSIDFQHPIFKPFDDPRFSDFSHIHFWKHRRWEIPPAVQAHVLAKFDDDSPALFQVDMGKGHLLVLTSSWSPADSQLAVSSKFPPLLQTMLDWSGASAPVQYQFHTGDAIPALASANQQVIWSKPSTDKPTSLPAATPFTDTDVPGIYKASWNGQERLFAVNIPLEESRTAPISQDELVRLGVPLGFESNQAAAVVRAQQQHLKDTELENRQKLWRWLIVAALGVTLGEIVLGGWLARRVAAAGAT